MARAVTAEYEELLLKVETTTPGTYAPMCGLQGVTITYTSEVEMTAVPDCDDESLPDEPIRRVTMVDWSASATGVWAQSSHEMFIQWHLTGAVKNIQICYVNASVGDVELITGPAILTSMAHTRTKGQLVTTSIELIKAGAVTTTDQT